MENKNKKSFPTRRLKQLLPGLQEALAQTNEKLNQLLSEQNTVTKAVVALPNCEMDQDGKEKDDVEDATLYFRLCSLAFNSRDKLEHDATWFAVPPCGEVDSEGYLSSITKEPREGCHVKKPFVVGSYIFLVSNPTLQQDKKTLPVPYRVVHYLDTQKGEGWKVACDLKSKPGMWLCHFLVANDKIYAFEFFNDCSSLAVSFMDCHQPNQWHYFFDANGVVLDCPMTNILASTIEYEEGKPGRRAQRALIFAGHCRLTFDFDTKSYVQEKERIFCCPGGICLDLGVIFFLSSVGHGELMAYNHRDKVRCRLPVLGLDTYLPVNKKNDLNFPEFELRLVRLDDRRLCLVWARFDYDAAYVRCTKFSVVEKDSGVYYATDVSSKEYKVKGSFSNGLEAVL